MQGKKIDQVFFLIYNYYYKDGNYKNGGFTKFYPWHYTIFVLSFGTMIWTIFITSAGAYYLNNKFINSSFAPIFIGCYFLYFSFYYSYFIKGSRFQKIYNEFKDTIYQSKFKSILAIIILIVLPLILIIVFTLIWHKTI
jgi:hypothetical protein